MDCKINQDQIIDFHFGKISMVDRQQVEQHLRSCPECLEEFFLFKRDAELAHEVILQPSKAVRSDIHREFSIYSQGMLSQQAQFWFKAHPKKIIFAGLAAAAAVAFLMLAHPSQWLHPKPSNQSSTGENGPSELVRSLDETVDSAGSSPGHINIL